MFPMALWVKKIKAISDCQNHEYVTSKLSETDIEINCFWNRDQFCCNSYVILFNQNISGSQAWMKLFYKIYSTNILCFSHDVHMIKEIAVDDHLQCNVIISLIWLNVISCLGSFNPARYEFILDRVEDEKHNRAEIWCHVTRLIKVLIENLCMNESHRRKIISSVVQIVSIAFHSHLICIIPW